jgi:hypothetical protein
MKAAVARILFGTEALSNDQHFNHAQRKLARALDQLTRKSAGESPPYTQSGRGDMTAELPNKRYSDLLDRVRAYKTRSSSHRIGQWKSAAPLGFTPAGDMAHARQQAMVASNAQPAAQPGAPPAGAFPPISTPPQRPMMNPTSAMAGKAKLPGAPKPIASTIPLVSPSSGVKAGQAKYASVRDVIRGLSRIGHIAGFGIPGAVIGGAMGLDAGNSVGYPGTGLLGGAALGGLGGGAVGDSFWQSVYGEPHQQTNRSTTTTPVVTTADSKELDQPEEDDPSKPPPRVDQGPGAKAAAVTDHLKLFPLVGAGLGGLIAHQTADENDTPGQRLRRTMSGMSLGALGGGVGAMGYLGYEAYPRIQGLKNTINTVNAVGDVGAGAQRVGNALGGIGNSFGSFLRPVTDSLEAGFKPQPGVKASAESDLHRGEDLPVLSDSVQEILHRLWARNSAGLKPNQDKAANLSRETTENLMLGLPIAGSVVGGVTGYLAGKNDKKNPYGRAISALKGIGYGGLAGAAGSLGLLGHSAYQTSQEQADQRMRTQMLHDEADRVYNPTWRILDPDERHYELLKGSAETETPAPPANAPRILRPDRRGGQGKFAWQGGRVKDLKEDPSYGKYLRSK